MNATVRLAASALLKNRIRTGLSILGIGIGIAAVICTAAIGAATTSRIERQIAALGDDFLWIRPGSLNLGGSRSGWGNARTLTAEDGRAIAQQVAGVSACSPVASGRVQLIAGAANWNTRYQGVLPSFFTIRRRGVVAGTLFTDFDVQTYARVIVLGPSVAANLFPGENPIGRQLRLGTFPFQVIGVADSRGADRAGVDRDDTIFIPFTTANRTLDRETWVSDIMCAVKPPEYMASAESAAASLLRFRHGLLPGEDDDFQIQHPIETIQLRTQTTRTMSAMLTGIAAVSLVVGGIGIMNIMLVAVAERRREIGVRMAVGARVRDIRRQFLVEAATLGLVGAGLGILTGAIAAVVLSVHFGWDTTVSPTVVTVATTAAICTAILFGFLPAHRASMLDPIEAIRIED